MTRALTISGVVLGSRAQDLAPPPLSLPPPGFTPLENPTQVYLAKNPHRHERGARSGAKLAGLRYEKKVKEWLRASHPHHVDGQWFYAVDDQRKRYAQPDFLIFDGPLTERPNRLTVVEIKTSWCALAWWQLVRLYAPIVKKFYAPCDLRLVCIARSFDPLTAAPEAPVLLDDLFGDLTSGKVGVFLWR